MCDFNKPIKFCTCSPEELPKEQYVWELSRFVREQPFLMGRLAMGSDEINGLTEDKVLKLLNAGGVFDFEYKPQESDSFRIRDTKQAFSFMSFIFDKGKWHPGGQGFSDYTSIHKGKIRNLGPEITMRR